MSISLDRAAVVRVGGCADVRLPGGLNRVAPAVPCRQVAMALQDAAADGHRLAVLVGGEPLFRPDLGRIARVAEVLGLRLGVVTGGSAPARSAGSAALQGRGLAFVRVVLPTPDAVEGVESVLEGLPAGDECRTEVAIPVVGAAVASLEGVPAHLAALRRPPALRLLAPLLPDAWPDPVEAALAVERTLDAARGLGIEAGWAGFPPCLLARHADARDERLRYGVPAYGPEDAGDLLFREEPLYRAHPWPCQECRHIKTCPGVPRPLADSLSASTLRPERSLRANSFNWVHERDLPSIRPGAGGCLGHALAAGAASPHALLLLDEGVTRLYRASTQDFDQDEVRYVRDEAGQVYLDTLDESVVTEFTTGLRRIRPHPGCSRCPDRDRCPRAFVVDPSMPFEADDAAVREAVASVTGRVLDVGCGDQRYREVIAAALAEGRIRYHGLDPDGAALSRLSAAIPGAVLSLGRIEDLAEEGRAASIRPPVVGPYDAVLCLRSVDHFADPGVAFSAIRRLLRPGGRLVMCETTVFGLLRSSAQVAQGESRSSGHEHWRNWTAEQAVEFLEPRGFRVDLCRPVTQRTSNLWLVVATRT